MFVVLCTGAGFPARVSRTEGEADVPCVMQFLGGYFNEHMDEVTIIMFSIH